MKANCQHLSKGLISILETIYLGVKYIYIYITSISQEKEIHQGIIYFAWIKQIGASNNENLLHVNKYFHLPRG
jgi:hypothetical protein